MRPFLLNFISVLIDLNHKSQNTWGDLITGMKFLLVPFNADQLPFLLSSCAPVFAQLWNVLRRQFFYFSKFFFIGVLQPPFYNTTNVTADGYCGSWFILHTEAPPSQAHNAIVRATWVAAAISYTDIFSLMAMISWVRRHPLTPWSYFNKVGCSTNTDTS